MKKWIQPASIVMAILWLTSCSPKISKIDYEKQTYELAQLQQRLDLLQKNQEKENYYASTGNIEKGVSTSNSNQKALSQLSQQYSLLQQKYNALQFAYDQMKGEKSETTTVQGVSVLEHNDLKSKYETLEKEYKSLEDKYNYMAANVDEKSTKAKKKKKSKKVKSPKVAKAPKAKKHHKVTKEKAVETPKVVKSTKTEFPAIGEVVVEEEELATSKQEWVHAIKTSNTEANLNDLYFSYKNFERLDNRLILEIRIANRGNKCKLKWSAENIQMIDNAGRIFEAKDYRIGKTYASRVTGKVTKKLKQDYTIQAVMAFEGVEPTLDNIKALRIIVELDGENTIVEFTNIELNTLTRSFNIEF